MGREGGFTFRGSRASGVSSGSEKMGREGGLPSEEAEPEGFVLGVRRWGERGVYLPRKQSQRGLFWE